MPHTSKGKTSLRVRHKISITLLPMEIKFHPVTQQSRGLNNSLISYWKQGLSYLSLCISLWSNHHPRYHKLYLNKPNNHV